MNEEKQTKKPETKSYSVTERAGPFVAGRRSPGAGQSIKLTEAQAETPLRNGEIKESETAKKDAETKTKNSGKGA